MTTPGSRRIRVLFMIDSLGPGGAEQTLQRVVEGIDQTTFEPRVAVLQIREGNPVADQIREVGIPVDVVEVDRLRSPSGHARLLRYLVKVRPQIIHTHLEFSHTLGGIYGRLVGARPIGTVHTFALGAASLERKRMGLMWLSLRRAHVKVIAPSHAAMEHIGSIGRVAPERLLVMHNGVDLHRFRPDLPAREHVREQLGIPPNARVLVVVAVLRKGKGVSDLISAMPEITELVPDVVALIVGDGEERAALARQAETSGMSHRVVFTGSRDDVPALMAAADVLVLPTHKDVLPTVVAEAMGAGLPVIASDVGGLREMVEDTITGILYPAGDTAALVKASVELLDDVVRAEALGAAGRARAGEHFDIRGQINALERLYIESLPR